jgi:hypothetical protein
MLVVRGGVRTLSDAHLRASGFDVLPTFANPWHFSVVLPDATPASFDALRECFGDPVANPGHQPED